MEDSMKPISYLPGTYVDNESGIGEWVLPSTAPASVVPKPALVSAHYCNEKILY